MLIKPSLFSQLPCIFISPPLLSLDFWSSIWLMLLLTLLAVFESLIIPFVPTFRVYVNRLHFKSFQNIPALITTQTLQFLIKDSYYFTFSPLLPVIYALEFPFFFLNDPCFTFLFTECLLLSSSSHQFSFELYFLHSEANWFCFKVSGHLLLPSFFRF